MNSNSAMAVDEAQQRDEVIEGGALTPVRDATQAAVDEAERQEALRKARACRVVGGVCLGLFVLSLALIMIGACSGFLDESRHCHLAWILPLQFVLLLSAAAL